MRFLLLRGWWLIAVVSLLLTLSLAAPKDALAQQPPANKQETAPADSQAAKEKSRAAFRRGVAQLKAQDWAGARASFEEAWSLVQHPSILLNLGIARLKTDDPVLAEDSLVRFLSEDPGAASDEISSARDALNEARSKIGTLRVIATPATARVVVDGKPAPIRASAEGGTGTAEVRLKAGKHAIGVDADGFNPDERSVDVPAKSETEIKVTLAAKDGTGNHGVVVKPKPTGPTTRTIVGWSLAGVGAGALLASGIMGVRAISLSGDYEDETNRATFQNPDVKDEGVAFRTGADIAFVAALLAGAGAAILLFTDIGVPKDVVAKNPRLPQPVLRW